jgi:imidazolonepropionase-like amidohydrolase
MTRFYVIVLICLHVVTGGAQTLAISHVTVIDATGSAPQPDRTVLISQGRIVSVAPSAQTRVPAQAIEVNGKGKYLIPGLWDMHTHWYDRAYQPLFTVHGITGVREMFGHPFQLKWRDEVNEGKAAGPRMLVSSPIVDGPARAGALGMTNITVKDDAEARQAVRTIKSDGYDFVKVYTHLSREAYFAIADESKKLGIPFAGHVPDAVTPWEASDAGQASIEHLEGIPEYCSNLTDRRRAKSSPEAYNPEKCAALFAELRKNHTWLCPTLSILYGSNVAVADPASMNDPRLGLLPPAISKRWTAAANRPVPRTEDALKAGNSYFRERVRITGEMNRAGIEILAGTDSAGPFVYPGSSLHEELALLVEAGLTPMQALRAATSNPARFMGKQKEFGTVEPGRAADLVLLNADPLSDIHNTRKIEAVIQRGVLIPRPELDKMLTMILETVKRGDDSKSEPVEPAAKRPLKVQ